MAITETQVAGNNHATTVINWQRFSVPYEYPVAFTRGLFSPANFLLADMLALKEPHKRHKCLVYLDSGLAEAQPDLIERIEAYFAAHAQIELLASPALVPGGERIKAEPGYVESIQNAIHRLGVDRHSYVIAIGGGAVLDAIGFAAATAHRGVRHIRIPSTVLSQNDSGVGVKNAVNLNGVKNFMGCFAPPWAVLNDFDLLESLSRRERMAGISEAIKVALIRDREFFEWLEANVDGLNAHERDVEEHMIRRSAELHMRQIAHGGDPFELGSARPLDFGHWAAHKLEALTHHEVHHGEAVAIGMALDARYSVLTGLLPDGEDVRIVSLLEGLGLATFHPALASSGKGGEALILTGLQEFREHLGGELTITLLADMGVGVEIHAMNPELAMQAVAWLQAREVDHALAG
ncbi:3-dehydroquinate synthase [Halomonas shantousis]